MSTNTIPVRVSPEAAAHVAELGLQGELEEMLAHTRQAVPGLRAIDVILAPACDIEDDPRVILEVTTPAPNMPYDPAETEWGKWFVRTFPPDVVRHFCMLTVYGVGNAG
jgi:hypothetical protein